LNGFRVFANPWWVNLLILVPFVSLYFWRRTGLVIERSTLALAAVLGLAFGFVEAVVVVYLRGAIGLVPAPGAATGELSVHDIPSNLLAIEVVREAATIAMLIAAAFLSARRTRERWAMFLYVFAIWDLSYYAGLWATIGWPPSLLTDDILFLIPVPWMSQVWYPVAVSGLSVLAVAFASGIGHRHRESVQRSASAASG
jgi:hypothetical protein